MLPEEPHNSQKDRNPLLSWLFQAFTKVRVGWRATRRGLIKSGIGRRNEGGRMAFTAPARASEVTVQPLCSQTDPMDGFGYIPVNEPFVFSVGNEQVSVAMGAGGAVIAKIPVETQAQAEELNQCGDHPAIHRSTPRAVGSGCERCLPGRRSWRGSAAQRHSRSCEAADLHRQCPGGSGPGGRGLGPEFEGGQGPAPRQLLPRPVVVAEALGEVRIIYRGRFCAKAL